MLCYLHCLLTPDWITALGTVGAVAAALVIALFGKQMGQWFFRPKLDLDAVVRRPDAEKVGRFQMVGPAYRPIGEAWFFRLAIMNSADAPARDVQVYLRRVEKADGSVVDKFTPMNLKWTNSGETTRKVLLRGVPVFCDFIHITDPASRSISGEDLNTVPAGQGVMALDVEAVNTANGHLHGPGAYLFHLLLAGENFSARSFAVKVTYNGAWYAEQDRMFDQAIGFRMEKLARPPKHPARA
ncbi:MAG TPA: hypothetical protein VKH18_03575 [Terriglobales bacterium]|nr:hypothetical protein [Terriglobales bacterium]